jgi:hypothetical protein
MTDDRRSAQRFIDTRVRWHCCRSPDLPRDSSGSARSSFSTCTALPAPRGLRQHRCRWRQVFRITGRPAAFMLAASRCRLWPPERPPLAPIRSLAEFQPVIDELLVYLMPENYLEYLRLKLHRLSAPVRFRRSRNIRLQMIANWYSRAWEAALSVFPVR